MRQRSVSAPVAAAGRCVGPSLRYSVGVQPADDKYSAAEQGLGYIYQARFALLKLLEWPEGTSLLMEKEDDVVLASEDGTTSLGSLKHKAVGDRLTNLSVDFWKSVKIWLVRYYGHGRTQSPLRFFLFTTAAVPEESFLQNFVGDPPRESLAALAEEIMSRSTSETVMDAAKLFRGLLEPERDDFLSRIRILADGPRIGDIPSIIRDQRMRTLRGEFRAAVFERLEGWWSETVIRLLTRSRTDPVFGHEVSDRLAAFAEEYRGDNLPITFRGKSPPSGVDAEGDTRMFVLQLREIGIASTRIRNAILDYYRAYEQRSAWAREDLLVAGEIEAYEDRLVDEWGRYRDAVFERLAEDSAEATLVEAGRELYRWADLQSGNAGGLRIRERVTEPYVVRGGLHILANEQPSPRVYWHPRFLDRLRELLSAAS